MEGLPEAWMVVMLGPPNCYMVGGTQAKIIKGPPPIANPFNIMSF